jgi:hypothetical protein
LTHLGKITVEIKTANVSGAGTNGRVYLGIGRREFRLNKPGNQFQPGSTDTFVIGAGGNINSPNNDNWNVESVRLTAQQYDPDPGDTSQYTDSFSENDNRIWLGSDSGLIIKLGGSVLGFNCTLQLYNRQISNVI